MSGPASASTSTAQITTLQPSYVPPKPLPPAFPPKPILKRPPPPPQTIFSFTRNILAISSKFLPPPPSPSATSFLSAASSPNGSSLSSASNGGSPTTNGDAAPGHQARSPSPLKRAHFIVPHLTTTYPISSQAPPSTPGLRESIHDIEDREAERRLRDSNDGNWTLERVEEFYKECCRLRDEPVLGGVIKGIRVAAIAGPRTLDLSGVKLSGSFSAAALADALSVEWGLRRLILKDTDLDDLTIKPILHALLIPQSLPYLSLAGNRRLKPPAFKLIGLFAAKAHALQFLDLSQTPLDKRSVEYIVIALESAPLKQSGDISPAPSPYSPSTPLISDGPSYFAKQNDGLPPSGFSTPIGAGEMFNMPKTNGNSGDITPTQAMSPTLVALPPTPTVSSPSRTTYRSQSAAPKLPKAKLISLRLDECGLRGGSLEVLAQAVRPSCLVNLSLRSNRIGPQGAVAIALMMKDYPDAMPLPSGLVPPGSPTPSFSSFGGTGGSIDPPPPSPRPSPFASVAAPKPPPRHPLSHQQQAPPAAAAATTYTPYIPRSRRNMVPAQQPQQQQGNVPVITSNRGGGVTTRHLPLPASATSSASSSPNSAVRPLPREAPPLQKPPQGKMDGHSAALLDKVRSLDNLPRLGALQTLDLKGNDLRNGVTYIAQVLKRNRTLKVLNLSENRVDVQGLMVIAEALKYNSTLETLDMSRNPCCGPGLEGITSIRTAFTINTSLKRLFLSSTGLTSAGAIALAEFIPEARSLLHLDLTHNLLDIAGVMALSTGLKMNDAIRCLDVNVPPNDIEFARLSREILKCCVRNTERAVSAAPRFENDKGGSSLGGGGDALGLGLGGFGFSSARGGVWGLIEKSELAKVVKDAAEKERLGEEKKELGSLGGKERYDVWRKTPPEIIRAAKECSEDLQLLLGGILPSDNGRKERLVERAQALASVIAEMVQVEKDTDTLQELLSLNDELLLYVKRIKTALEATLTLDMPSAFDPSEIMSPSPKIDRKGKGKATPQDEEPPELLYHHQQPPVVEEPAERSLEAPSPVERSRKWVEEEGEVFRKGTVLLGPEEMGEVEEGDGAQVAGDVLRIELLEAQVERPRHRLLEDFETVEGQAVPPDTVDEARTPLSPR